MPLIAAKRSRHEWCPAGGDTESEGFASVSVRRQEAHSVSPATGRKAWSSPGPWQVTSPVTAGADGGGADTGPGSSGSFCTRRWRRKPTAERTPSCGSSAIRTRRRSAGVTPRSSHLAASAARARASGTPRCSSRREWRSESNTLSASASSGAGGRSGSGSGPGPGSGSGPGAVSRSDSRSGSRLGSLRVRVSEGGWGVVFSQWSSTGS